MCQELTGRIMSAFEPCKATNQVVLSITERKNKSNYIKGS